MPFDPPDTVASVGTTGYLSTFELGDNESPPNFTAIAEVKSFNFTPLDVPNVDFSTLVSPNNTRELKPGMIMPGKIEVSGNYIGDATQLTLPTNAQAQTIFPFKATFPLQDRTKTGTFIGIGFVNTLKVGPFENDKPNEFSASFQATGSFSLTTA